MRILHREEGMVKVKVDSVEDLWALSRVINEGDLAGAKTTRAIEKGRSGTEKRRSMFVKIEVEKIKFQKYSNILRLLGKIKECSNEDVSHGSYHTLKVEEDKILKIWKDFKNYEIEKLKEAEKLSKSERLLLCSANYGEVSFALLRGYSVEKIGSLTETLPGKREAEKYTQAREEFLEKIIPKIESKIEETGVSKVLFGGTGFLNKNLKKKLKEKDLKNKISFVKVSAGGEPGINELIKSGVIDEIVKKNRVAFENDIVGEFFKKISKDSGKVRYGMEEVKEVVKMGAVERLLVSDQFIQEERREGNFEELENVMEETESKGGKVNVISSENEAGERFEKFKIAAFLRYAI